jgi:hypothetical protein
MQVPLWFYLSSVFLVLLCSDMAAILSKRLLPTISSAIINPAPRLALLSQHISNLPTPFTRSFAHSTANMSATPFLETIKNRRTIYQLEKSSPIPDSRIQEIIKEALLHVPSSFNSQSTRIVLLVKDEHDKLWETTKDVLKGVVPADAFPATEQKLNGFKGAYATVRCSSVQLSSHPS